ncbi:LPA [Branchiostoma lanceolatum]|uniref:LPA protein n=1 Tax=Branchiostoma lanceolatum TaxID=7740 RepID=A0A8J9Z7J9_BRALA|nr:LPA [Branchiostoma lanceolatum]
MEQAEFCCWTTNDDIWIRASRCGPKIHRSVLLSCSLTMQISRAFSPTVLYLWCRSMPGEPPPVQSLPTATKISAGNFLAVMVGLDIVMPCIYAWGETVFAEETPFPVVGLRAPILEISGRAACCRPGSHVYQSVDEDDIDNRRQTGMDCRQPTNKKEDTTLPIKARKKAADLRNNPLYASSEQMKKKVVTQDSSWAMNSTGTPYVNDGVICDAGKALDGDIETYWNPVCTARYQNNWLIVLDLAAPITLTSIAVIHWGHTNHDIAKFRLQKSEAVCPYNWEDVVYITDVQGGTDQHQQFGGFQETARYWRFVVTRTHTGWQPWLNELYLYPITTHCQVGDGASYRGTVSVTDTGITCQRWDSQTPHGHDMTPADYVSSGLEKNYCRNPDGEAGVWCYTMDPSTRWTYCKVAVCAARSARCPVGYRLIARTCIKLDFRLKSYRTAEAACKRDGAELAMPKTKELDVALRILVRTESHRQSYWFGLKDKGGFLLHQRNWQWADGSSLGNYKPSIASRLSAAKQLVAMEKREMAGAEEDLLDEMEDLETELKKRGPPGSMRG